MYKIGELSQLCGLPVKTLRYWSDIGLLEPSEIDRFTGYRYYSAAKLADCCRIVALKELGFTLEEIRRRMREEDPGKLIALIEAKENELKAERRSLEASLRRLEVMRNNMIEGEKNMFDLRIKREAPMRAAYIRSVYPDRDSAFGDIDRICRSLPKKLIGQRCVLINSNTEYSETDFDLTACVEITGALPADSAWNERVLAFESEAASVVCQKEELDTAYCELNQQLGEMSLQIVGAFFEVYHDDGTVELKVPVCRLTDPQDPAEEADEPFVNDPDAVGMWELADVVPSEEQFLPGHVKLGDRSDIGFTKLCFLPEGGAYWIVRGWTKGKIFMSFGYPKYTAANSYRIETRGGETYMFIFMKDRFYARRGGKPLVYVYRRLDNLAHTVDDIRIRDNVDLPFVGDARVIGKWAACDCIRSREGYLPDVQHYPSDGLFCKTLEFREDGTAVQVRENGEYTCGWTKGTLLERGPELASAYELCEIDGKEYLFVEWKSGDYKFAGRVNYYVYSRM